MHPVLLEFGPVRIFTYGLLVATGFFTAIWLAGRQAREEGMDAEAILDLSFYILVGSILGARALYVIVEYRHFLDAPLDVFKVWKGGLVFYGGLIVAASIAAIYIRKHGLPLWKTADIFAPSIAIGQAIGRWGCLFAGCCYGKPTDLSWGIVFTDVRSLAPLNVPLHPTQIYLSLNALAIFGILVWLRKRKSFDGQLFWTYGALYSVGRFLIEFFRGDDRGFAVQNTLSTSQFIGIFTLILSIYMFRVLRNSRN